MCGLICPFLNWLTAHGALAGSVYLEMRTALPTRGQNAGPFCRQRAHTTTTTTTTTMTCKLSKASLSTSKQRGSARKCQVSQAEMFAAYSRSTSTRASSFSHLHAIGREPLQRWTLSYCPDASDDQFLIRKSGSSGLHSGRRNCSSS